jgi:hypothetical protein
MHCKTSTGTKSNQPLSVAVTPWSFVQEVPGQNPCHSDCGFRGVPPSLWAAGTSEYAATL